MKYYDANWMATTREKARYYAEFVNEGDNYLCTSHWIAGNAVRGRTNYQDTIMQNPRGTQVLYFKNGHVEDSTLYENGKVKFVYHYYPNNKLGLHYYLPDNQKEPVTEGYDEDGKKIKNYVFEREVIFKGGDKAWQSYLQNNVSKDIEVKEKGDITAQVQLEFIVDEDGNVSRAKILKSSGYKEIDKDALRIISESPVWNNAIQFNRPVKAYRVQPFTYTIKDKK